MWQMAQIILFMASVALDSLIMTPSRHRGTMQQTSASVCSQWWCSRGWQCLSEPQMMWLWVNRTLITGQGICLLHVYIPMMHEMSWEMDFISSAWCIVTYQASTRRYRACVIWRRLPSGPEIMLMSLPGLTIELMQPAVGYTAHIRVLYNLYLIQITPPDIF